MFSLASGRLNITLTLLLALTGPNGKWQSSHFKSLPDHFTEHLLVSSEKSWQDSPPNHHRAGTSSGL